MEAAAMPESARIDKEAIARRAYEIWEAEGCPHGRDRDHWEAAARELGSAAPMPADYRDGEGIPGPAALKKPAARRKKAAQPAEAEAAAAAPRPARRKRATPV
jgi:hypothetical protein